MALGRHGDDQRARTRTCPNAPMRRGTHLVACSSPTDNAPMEFRLPVEVAEVGKGVVEDVVRTSGLLRTPEGVTIAIETPGRLQVGRNREGERLREGAVVEAGQVVARVLGEEATLHARVEATRRALHVPLPSCDDSMSCRKPSWFRSGRCSRRKACFKTRCTTTA